MSTPKAPPPPPKKAPATEAEKQSAADQIAAALGSGAGVNKDTGAVSASAVKEKAAKAAAEGRVEATPPASTPKPPAKTKPAPPTNGKPTAETPPATEVPDAYANALGGLTLTLAETKNEVGALADQLKKFQTKTDKTFADFREALAALMEAGKATFDEVKAVKLSAPNPDQDVRVEVRAVDHGKVRSLFSALPDEPEWIEEWAEKAGQQFDVPSEEMAQMAREFGFTREETVEDYTGTLVCIDYDEPTGV